MADSRGRSGRHSLDDNESMFGSRSLEAFSRKVTATAGHLLGDVSARETYHQAMGEISREMRHPLLQRQVFNLSQATPRELVRSKLSTTEIQHRALAYLPDEMLSNLPENNNPFSLFQGFQATLPATDAPFRRSRHGRHSSTNQALLTQMEKDPNAPPALKKLRNEKDGLEHRLEMMNVRKNMCSTEIREIDAKIANLNTMRKIVLDRLADLEQEESLMEREMLDLDNQLDDLQEEWEDTAALAGQRTPVSSSAGVDKDKADSPAMEASFMSESVYEKIPSPKPKRMKAHRRKTNFILHEHLQAGSNIRKFHAHTDVISALDFDVPFGTLVTAALDDTVRVWDLNAGRCMGMLEGHLSSVRCLQVEDNLVATGSMDASVRLWDLSQADYTPPPDKPSNRIHKSGDDALSGSEDDDLDDFTDASEAPPTPPPSNMRDCAMFTLSAHVAEITALHFHNNTLVSGSADKTLRQWDLESGRCVQTLDVLWAAAQASSSVSASSTSSTADPSRWRQSSGRLPDANADFVGALQCFDAALACGTADGMVRLWDLRSGQVHRSLVGHTGPVTCLQFDDTYLVTGSLDRSVRIWDLRTGAIADAYAYDNPVTSMMFDARSIVAAAGEPVVKVYDKAEMRNWDCGAPEGFEQSGYVRPGSIVEKVRVKDGYLIEGRKDGSVGVWSC